MGQPHKHAEIIKAWADGASIEVKCGSGNWEDIGGSPAWADFNEYRIKPEYPKTRMSVEDRFRRITMPFPAKASINIVGATHAALERGTERLADAAIARAIEDGDVVPAAMLEAVAKEVKKAYTQVRGYGGGSGSSGQSSGGGTWCVSGGGGMAGGNIPVVVDIPAIIKRVKEGK